MARLFNGTSHRYYLTGVPLPAAVPISMMAWFNPQAVVQDGTLVSIAPAEGSVNDNMRLIMNATGFEISASSRAGAGTEQFATTSGAGTAGQAAGVWGCGVGVWASITDRRAFYGRPGIAAIKSTNAVSTAPAAPAVVSVGARQNDTVLFKGHLAHAAIWRVALSDAEAQALCRGAHPLTIRPDQLIAYWPLETGTSGLDRPRDLGPKMLKPLIPTTAATGAGPVSAATGQTVVDPAVQVYQPPFQRQLYEMTRERIAPPASGGTPISGSDSGVGTDTADLTAQLPLAETGAGADAGTLTAALAGSDSSSGADTAALAAAASISDSSSGSDTGAMAGAIPGSDAAAGSDAGSLKAFPATADGGTGADGSAVVASAAGSDTGSGSEASSLAAALSASDSGVGSETVTTGTPVSISDAATSTETLSVVVKITAADSGSGAEVLTLGASVLGAETALGSDAVSGTTRVSIADAGLGTDTASFVAGSAVTVIGTTRTGRVAVSTAGEVGERIGPLSGRVARQAPGEVEGRLI